MELTGLITDIQRFSLHDGPGIRTSVFLKGCNLDCLWCHNPEAISFEPDVLIDSEKCISCGKCEEGCFSGARRIAGRRYTIDELMAEILQDKDYYGKDGGVTLTGGEPACQPDFTAGVLDACKKAGIGRVLETNLCYEESLLKRLAALCDIVYCDLKIWDEAAHLSLTGESNRQVKQNLKVLSDLGASFAVRTTIVPGLNDTREEIESIAGFLSGLPGILFYELLSYNPLGLSKKLEGKDERRAFSRIDKENMLVFAGYARETGLRVRVDGVECGGS